MSKALMDRRSFLQWSGIATTMFWFGNHTTAAEEFMPAIDAVDHLLLAINDLNRGIAWVEKNFGVKAMIGGSHPGAGTRNALLSLGGKRYLEIIAPDPEQKTYGFPIDVRTIQEPQLVMWAAGTTNIQAVVKKATDAGLKMMGPFDGSRNRPDGRTL
ncbi:MAG TPA: VOC family protein, partial [Acidobacteriota bacterium]|nr:VOC family protein [Acidobacteriota bacterium]